MGKVSMAGSAMSASTWNFSSTEATPKNWSNFSVSITTPNGLTVAWITKHRPSSKRNGLPRSWGLCPQTPRVFGLLGHPRGRKTKGRVKDSAPRYGHRSRRSGRSPALPYPPLRYLILPRGTRVVYDVVQIGSSNISIGTYFGGRPGSKRLFVFDVYCASGRTPIVI